MRQAFVAFMAVAAVVLLSGCGTMPNSAILAPITIDQHSPVAMGDRGVAPSKVGTAEVEGILIFTTGDASISAAMQNGGITEVHHVDSESLNVLGIYSRYITRVYGE